MDISIYLVHIQTSWYIRMHAGVYAWTHKIFILPSSSIDAYVSTFHLKNHKWSSWLTKWIHFLCSIIRCFSWNQEVKVQIKCSKSKNEVRLATFLANEENYCRFSSQVLHHQNPRLSFCFFKAVVNYVTLASPLYQPCVCLLYFPVNRIMLSRIHWIIICHLRRNIVQTQTTVVQHVCDVYNNSFTCFLFIFVEA